MSRRLLLDTCAALWTTNPNPRFVKTEALLEQELQRGGRLYVSPITAWEVGLLASRGRLALNRDPLDWFAALRERVLLAEISSEILIQASYLPQSPLRDPADQIIAATARALGMTVVTRDSKLLAYAESGWLSALEC